MLKAIGSKVWLDSNQDPIAIEFRSIIYDLLKLEDVQNLDNYVQHLNTSRLQHSINVAYYTYITCKKLRLDYRSGTRGAMLHDLYLYDWRTGKQPEGRHVKAHPQIALRTARKNIELNHIEADAIIKHMWPATLFPPKYKESIIVSLMDKYCAVLEIVSQIFLYFKENLQK